MAEQHFYGFEPKEAERRLSKVLTRPDPARPAIHKLHDVVALPGFRWLYDSNGFPINAAAAVTVSPDAPARLRDRLAFKMPAVRLPSNLTIVEEPVLVGGCLFHHFGHFLIDSMSRLWARNLFPTLPMLFTTDREQPPFGIEILDALGVQSRILSVDRPTVFQEVICPGPSFEYRWKAYSVADEPHTTVASTISSNRRWRRPVCLTRSGLPDQIEGFDGLLRSIRKSEAEPELEAELARRGFDIVRPEELSLGHQISLFEQAPLIVGARGSAFHTALFPRSSEATLAVLNWGRKFENCLLVDALKQHRSCYIKSMRSTPEGEHVLDVALTITLLERAGLIAPHNQVHFGRVAAAR